MTAEMIPFPGARRVARVRLIAQTMARLSADRSENHLITQVRFELERLTELGVPLKVAEADVISFTNAIRSELWREVFSRPGDGGAA